MALVAGLAACAPEPGGGPYRSTGSYPIDIFPEMHYNQSYKSQEPPRLEPPADSVPFRSFAEDPAASVEELSLFVKDVPLPAQKADAKGMLNPLPKSTALLEEAARLFALNCAVCHGATAAGDGHVGNLFGQYRITTPPAFDSARIRALTPGEAYWSITKGTGFMPPFGNLLTPTERWKMVDLILLSQEERLPMLRHIMEEAE